jgi:hypothetical protein
MIRKIVLALCMATLLLLGTGTAFGQCSWSTKVVLSQTTSDQPGLATYTPASGINTIYLMYVGTDSNRTLNAMESTNGTSWGSQTPLKGWQSSHGVALAGAPPNSGGCPYLITAWPNRSNNVLYAATSANGYQWSGPYSLTLSSTATPAINPGNGDIAYQDPTTTMIAVMPATCSLHYNPDNPPTWHFFGDAEGCPFPTDCTTTSSGSPAFPAPLAIAMGTNQPIWAQTYVSAFELPGGSNTYSGYGVTGTYIPSPGGSELPTYYLAWRGGSGNINFWSSLSGLKVCSDTSNSAPAMTFFNGFLYVAWRSSSNNTINIASIGEF